MSELSAAITKLDDVARMLDGAVAQARPGSGTLVVDVDAVTSAVTKVHGLLDIAVPDSVASIGASFTPAPEMHLPQLIGLRRSIARLGAAAHSVEELGGTAQVISRGGLDAIDGAAAVYQRHMSEYLRGPLDQLRRAIDDGPGLFDRFDEQLRRNHIERVEFAAQSVADIGKGTGLVPRNASGLVPKRFYFGPDRTQYKDALQRAGKLHELTRGLMNGKGEQVVEDAALLRAGVASAQAARLGIDVPAGALLSSIVDDAELVAAAPLALEQHARLLTDLGERLGVHNRYSQEFAAAAAPFATDFGFVLDDVRRLQPLLQDAPESASTKARALAEWMEFGQDFATKASRGTNPGGGDNMLKMFGVGSELATDLAAELRRILDDPTLARVRIDVADEVTDILGRPGEIDTAALRTLLAGDAPSAARAALVEQFATDPRRLMQAGPPAASVDDAVRRLDEADLLADAVTGIAQRTSRESYVYGLTEPGIREAITDIAHRRSSALGTSSTMPQDLSSRLRDSSQDMLERLAAHDSESASYMRVGSTVIDQSNRAAAAFRNSLVELSERATRDGGLRTLSPSSRRGEAGPANVRWLVRELDSLAVPAADASPEQRIDHAARRLSLLADLTEALGDNDPLAKRLVSELQSIEGRWQMPDDVSLSLQRLASMSSDEFGAGRRTTLAYGPVPTMRRSAADLRAWNMLEDGILPASDIDRHAVGARRATEAAKAASHTPRLGEYKSTDPIVKWADELRHRISDIEATLGDFAPRDELAAVHRAQESLERHLDEYRQLAKVYRSSEWNWHPRIAEEYRDVIDAFARRIEQDHVTARAAAQAG